MKIFVYHTRNDTYATYTSTEEIAEYLSEHAAAYAGSDPFPTQNDHEGEDDSDYVDRVYGWLTENASIVREIADGGELDEEDTTVDAVELA